MNKKRASRQFWLLMTLSALALHCDDSGHTLGTLVDGSPGDTADAAALPDQPLASDSAVGTGGAAGGGGITLVGGAGGANTGGGVGTGGAVGTGGRGLGGDGRGTGGSGAGGDRGADAAADGRSDVAVTTDAEKLAALCTSTGGEVDTMSCCSSVDDFPDLCKPGACACPPASSHIVAACTCPAASCFSRDVGCLATSGGGGAGGTSGGTGGSGAGGSDGGTVDAGGSGGSDGGKLDIVVSPDAQPLADLCLATGGQLDTWLCCNTAGDLTDTCSVGPCGCPPEQSQTTVVCVCPHGCFMPEYGCLGPANVCTAGADQTCNDNPAISSLHGTCVPPEGRCACGPSGGLSPTSGKCL